jgi:hypothetical protein
MEIVRAIDDLLQSDLTDSTRADMWLFRQQAVDGSIDATDRNYILALHSRLCAVDAAERRALKAEHRAEAFERHAANVKRRAAEAAAKAEAHGARWMPNLLRSKESPSATTQPLLASCLRGTN